MMSSRVTFLPQPYAMLSATLALKRSGVWGTIEIALWRLQRAKEALETAAELAAAT